MGEAHFSFLRRFLPYHQHVLSVSRLTILMSRIDSGLFSAALHSLVRDTWPPGWGTLWPWYPGKVRLPHVAAATLRRASSA